MIIKHKRKMAKFSLQFETTSRAYARGGGWG